MLFPMTVNHDNMGGGDAGPHDSGLQGCWACGFSKRTHRTICTTQTTTMPSATFHLLAGFKQTHSVSDFSVSTFPFLPKSAAT